MSSRLSSIAPISSIAALLLTGACTDPAVLVDGSGGAGGATTSASTGGMTTGGVTTGNTTTGSMTTGGTTTGGMTTGSTTTGGMTTGSATTGAGSGSTSSGSSSASSGSGGGACSGYIDILEMGAAPQHFASSCMDSWDSTETHTALGYNVSGGAAPGISKLVILGCANAGAPSAGITFGTPNAASPGTFVNGGASYTDSAGQTWSTLAGPYQLTITKLDPPGGVIEGTFAVTVAGPTDASRSLTGTFHVCRVQDELAP